MANRELIPATPYDLRQQTNFDLADKQLALLDDNARFIVRRMIGRAYTQGYNDGWAGGQDDARTDRMIERQSIIMEDKRD